MFVLLLAIYKNTRSVSACQRLLKKIDETGQKDMDCKIREWDRRADIAFFKKAELEAFKGTLPNADDLTESEIRNKLKEMDENDPVDLTDPSHEVFIAEKDEAGTIGLAWIQDRDPFWRFETQLTWIFNLYVIPQFRRKGIARQLLQHIEAWTRKQRLSRIGLHVIEWNTAARKLYESLGYSLVHSHNESRFYEKVLSNEE